MNIILPFPLRLVDSTAGRLFLPDVAKVSGMNGDIKLTVVGCSSQSKIEGAKFEKLQKAMKFGMNLMIMTAYADPTGHELQVR